MSSRKVFLRIQILMWFVSLTLFLQISGSQFVIEKFDCVSTNNSYQISLLHDLSQPVISPLHCAYFCNKENNCVAYWITAKAFCQLYQFDSESTTKLNLTTKNFCRKLSLAAMVSMPKNTTPVTNLVTAPGSETTSLVTEIFAASGTATNTNTNTTTSIIDTSGSTTAAACTPQTPSLLRTCVCDQTLGGLFTVVPSLSDTKCWLLCAVWAELGNNCTSFAYDPFLINNCKLTASGTNTTKKTKSVVCYCKDL